MCPGQGSQTPGFLTPWLYLPGVRERAGEIGEACGIDLIAHGTVSDEETIKDTAVAQPLIVAAGLLTAPAVLGPNAADLVAGHSVGEITATALAGVLDDGSAVRFVAQRARGMAEASAATPTGMTAVLGGTPDDVAATLERHGLTAANMNGGGQVVAAGTMEQLAALAADPPAKARVIPLKVAGAFHTEHMAPAVPALAELANTLTAQAPSTTLLSNRDGAAIADGREAVDRLVAQVTRPVRWDQCMEAMLTLGVTAMIELAPAGTLVGLAKRGMKGVETLAVKTPDDLDAASTLIAAHAGSKEQS